MNEISRRNIAKNLGHSPKIIWLTGLPGVGKTTLANGLESEFSRLGFHVYLLDENSIQLGLNKDIQIPKEKNKEGVRRIGEVASILFDSGLIVLVSAVSPFRADRQLVINRIGESNFIEIFLDCTEEIRLDRLKKAMFGILDQASEESFCKKFYEAPYHPDLHLRTDKEPIQNAVKKVMKYVLPTLVDDSKGDDFSHYSFIIV